MEGMTLDTDTGGSAVVITAGTANVDEPIAILFETDTSGPGGDTVVVESTATTLYRIPGPDDGTGTNVYDDVRFPFDSAVSPVRASCSAEDSLGVLVLVDCRGPGTETLGSPIWRTAGTIDV